MYKIKVLIVEDDLDWSKTLVNYLKKFQDIQIISTLDNKDDAVRLVQKEMIDVILMDINLTGNRYEGIYAAFEICQICNTKIIMLTCIFEEETILDSFKAGAVNYVLKTNYKEIPNSIRSVYNSNLPTAILAQSFKKLIHEEQLNILTPAEKEIISLLNKGYSQRGIQEMLVKSESTVKNQINRILKKYGVHNSKEALLKIRMGGLPNEKN